MPDDVEQHVDLAFVQRRSGFVHDDELGLEADRARDRHHLLRRGAEAHQRPANVDIDLEPRSRARASLCMRRQSSSPKRRRSRPRQIFSVIERKGTRLISW